MALDRVRLFDAHLHIIDRRFPLVPNKGYLPDAFTCIDYLERMGKYDLQGGAVVSGSFQAFDQSYLLDALERLGPAYTGVTQLPVTVTDEELVELNRVGVRAIRFNMQRGGSASIDDLDRMARRVHELAAHGMVEQDPGRRADIYAEFLSTCAACHTRLGQGPR